MIGQLFWNPTISNFFHVLWNFKIVRFGRIYMTCKLAFSFASECEKTLARCCMVWFSMVWVCYDMVGRKWGHHINFSPTANTMSVLQYRRVSQEICNTMQLLWMYTVTSQCIYFNLLSFFHLTLQLKQRGTGFWLAGNANSSQFYTYIVWWLITAMRDIKIQHPLITPIMIPFNLSSKI